MNCPWFLFNGRCDGRHDENRGGNQENRTNGGNGLLFVACVRPSSMLVYLRDGSAQTILRAATLR